MPTASVPAAVSGGGYRGWSSYPSPYYGTIGANGMPVVFVPSIAVYVPSRIPVNPQAGFQGQGGFGLAGPLPPGGIPRVRPGLDALRKKADPAKASQLVTIGDRLHRAGNTRRAEERYEQAARANSRSAAPRARLAQIAVGRGRYAEAANHLREAQAAEQG